jgi:hypothetical protein
MAWISGKPQFTKIPFAQDRIFAFYHSFRWKNRGFNVLVAASSDNASAGYFTVMDSLTTFVVPSVKGKVADQLILLMSSRSMK